MGHDETPRRYFFPKEEKLCSKKIISDLFERGNSFRIGVLKFFYLSNIDPLYQRVPVQVAFSAPKRSFKKAYMRNRLKRRMREAYRLQKHQLLPNPLEPNLRLAIFITYSSRNEVPYKTLASSMRKGLLKIKSQIELQESSSTSNTGT